MRLRMPAPTDTRTSAGQRTPRANRAFPTSLVWSPRWSLRWSPRLSSQLSSQWAAVVSHMPTSASVASVVRPAVISTVLLCCTAEACAQTSNRWAAWWHTDDQRAEAALRAGDAARAARTYTDPRRKAFAQLQAGAHRDAAAGYAALDDAESAYNRGNALARAGDLQLALQAYDNALAKNPADLAAQRNRALVAAALGQPPQGGGQARGPSPLAGGGAAPQPTAPAASQQRGAQPPGREASAGDSRNAGELRAPNALNTPNTDRSADAARSSAAQPNAATRADEPATDSAAQARRDLAGSRGPAPVPNGAAADGDAAPTGQADARHQNRTAPTEQQLAEAQWLRRLPDDASGLLRRKFLIQYQIREGNPP